MIIHYHSLQQKGEILPHAWSKLMGDDPPPWLWANGPALSLTEFIVYFNDPQRHLFAILTEDAQDCIGLLWIDDIFWGVRARLHMYVFKKYRGKKSSRLPSMCREFLQLLAAPPFNLQTLLFFTDSRAADAIKAAQTMGAVYLDAELPAYYPGGYPVRIGYLPLKGHDHA